MPEDPSIAVGLVNGSPDYRSTAPRPLPRPDVSSHPGVGAAGPHADDPQVLSRCRRRARRCGARASRHFRIESKGADLRVRLFGVTAAAVLLASWSTAGQSKPGAHGATECTMPALQQKAPPGTTITAAAVVAAEGTTPGHCRVDGHVATPGNTVNFRLGLPVAWNGKFFFQGVGGFAGTIGSLNAGLEKGYASASTDTGHQGSVIDASWALNNPAKRIDYAYRGTHVAAVAAKALSQAFYGTAAAPRVLRRVFEWRAAGVDGSAALSGGLRRDHRWRSVVRHAGTAETHARLSNAVVLA